MNSQTEIKPFDLLTPFSKYSFVTRQCGVGKQVELEVPEHWSQNACNILADKYIRKAGVPSALISDPGATQSGGADIMPAWLAPKTPAPGATFGSETSAIQVISRLAGCWTMWAWVYGYFNKPLSFIDHQLSKVARAEQFYTDCVELLVEQKMAPNSPQWFNTGLNWAYGITGRPQGHWFVDANKNLVQSKDSYVRPQPSACFIQSISDSLVGEGGIMDLASNEARLFKFGSGTGTNFSSLRAKGEKLGSGGVSSGVMSFLKIGDVSAGSIKSGGTTRRAAKMVILDMDHPEIEEFVNWKRVEEEKVAFLNAGAKLVNDFAKDCYAEFLFARVDDYEAIYNNLTRQAVKKGLPANIVQRVYALVENKLPFTEQKIDYDWQGEAYQTVSGQNSNNSVSVSNAFMERTTMDDDTWHLTARKDGSVVKTVSAKKLWNDVCYNAWACADPGIHFSDTINLWHTCKTDGRIEASNPCSEYLFLNDTACNLASINLANFMKADGTFDVDAYIKACQITTMILDVSVSMGQYPTKEIAMRSDMYRTLGLGHANIGGLLMRNGIPYDSEDGRNIAANLTALMTGVAYATSAELASRLGTFPRFDANKESVRNVLLMHKSASDSLFNSLSNPDRTERTKLTNIFGTLLSRQNEVWHNLCNTQPGEYIKVRNAQVSVIAPTGTIALVMDCDTTGIEPDFSLVKYKTLAGGGFMVIANRSVLPALHKLGYTDVTQEQVDAASALPNGLEQLCVSLNVTPEEWAVFACANDISPKGHVDMMAACQPFISGAISKTVNMPVDATVQDVKDLYEYAFKVGVKAIAIYRDQSKFSQPLTVAAAEPTHTQKSVTVQVSSFEEDKQPTGAVVEVREPVEAAPQRKRLPNTRKSLTQTASINGHKLYLHVGEYETGQPGEIFISMQKEGSSLGGLLNNVAVAVSLGLQYGVPLEEFVEAFVGSKAEPSGMVRGHDNIKMCESPLDYIMRHMAIHYLQRDDLAHVKPQRTSPEAAQPDLPKPDVPVYPMAEAAASSAPKYSGDACSNCGKFTLRRNGTCLLCDSCGSTTGCS